MSKFLDLDGLDYFTRNYIKPQLTEIIDGGVKNKLNLYNRFEGSRTTIIDGDNGTIAISTTQKWANMAYVIPVAQNTDYVFTLYVDEASCADVLFMVFINSCTEDGTTIIELGRTNRITTTGTYILTFNTSTADYVKVRINLNNQATDATGSATIRAMLCTATDYKVSTDYQPYNKIIATNQEILDVFNRV